MVEGNDGEKDEFNEYRKDHKSILTNEDSLTTIFPLTNSSRGPVTPFICSFDRGMEAEDLTASVQASCAAFSPSFFFFVTQYFLPYDRAHKSNILAEDGKPTPVAALTSSVPAAVRPLEEEVVFFFPTGFDDDEDDEDDDMMDR